MKHIILSFAAFAALNADDAIINHSTTQQNQSQQEEYETELKPILSPLKSLLEENTQEEQVESNENNDNKDQTKQYDFSGYIGIFNKTNLGSIKDNYNNFSASIELGYNIQNTLFFGIGIYGATPLYEYPKYNAINNYINKKFITNTAYIKYVTEGFFNINAGRYHEDRDWLKHYVQGTGIDIQYNSFKVWANWVDEQAHANREHITDFDIYKNTYNDEFLWAGGLILDVPFFTIAPYYYAMNKYFWSVGGKLESQLKNDNGWGYQTTLHYTYLKSKTNNLKNEHSHDHSHSNLTGDSSIVWFDHEIKYSCENGSVVFGGGYLQVWKSYFELASIGNMSRFETHSHSEYDVIEPGGIDNGINTSNMFNANTRTFYGFVGMEIKDFALMALGRNSKGNNITQDAYSLGFKWNVMLGVSLGGIGTYMIDNKRNLSFIKGYIEFKI